MKKDHIRMSEEDKKYRFYAYIGSKYRYLDFIFKQFPKTYRCYCEPFIGSYSVALNLPIINKYRNGSITSKGLPGLNVNDLDEDIICLAKVMAFQGDAFIKGVKNMLQVQGFHQFLKTDFHPITDLDRAIRKFYLLYFSFNKQTENPSFAYHVISPKKANFDSFDIDWEEVKYRLQLFTIFNEDWKKFLNRFVERETEIMIYLDPPYFASDTTSKGNYVTSKIVHSDLANYLQQFNGDSNVKWLLSYNDCKDVREMYQENIITDFEANYLLQKHKFKEIYDNELLIRNYSLTKKKKSKLETFF